MLISLSEQMIGKMGLKVLFIIDYLMLLSLIFDNFLIPYRRYVLESWLLWPSLFVPTS